MANNNKHTAPNVPALRFPEFSGEWEQCQIKDFGKVITGSTPPTSKTEYYDNGEFLWASPADLGNVKDVVSTKTKLSQQGFDKCRKIPAHSILVTCIGSTIGKMGMATTEMATNQQINSIIPIDCSPDYVYYSIQSRFPKYITSIATQAVPILSKSVFESLDSYKTSIEEQNKIGKLLHLLDERIDAQSKIIEELTTLRSALYDSMFCSPEQEMPKFRIQSFSGKWQLCQLNEICSRKSIKNKDNLYSRVLTIAAQHGLVDQESFFKKRIASENLESYLCLEKGDFAYNKSYSSDYPWGAVKRLSNFDKGIISPLYICFTPKPEVVDPDYLAHYFESTKWHSGISEISGEGARNHGLLNMSVIDYFNTCHRIPGLDEQKAIARRLNAIAHKLQTEQEYLELLNRQKDCFLKQMFI